MHSELGNMNHYYSLNIMQLLSRAVESAIDFLLLFFELPLHFINAEAQFIRTCYTTYVTCYSAPIITTFYTRINSTLPRLYTIYICVLVVFGKSIGRLKALDFTLYHSFMLCYYFGISCFLRFAWCTCAVQPP